ncbi:MAG: GNAT family N-acetyltransferase [Chloroflexota bacterium]
MHFNDPTLTVRAPTRDDASVLVELINAADMHDYGEIDLTVEDLLDDWARVDLQRNAWLVIEPSGRIAGYGEVQAHAVVQLRIFLTVHPDRRGEGIGDTLLSQIEQRAIELVPSAPDGARVTLEGFAPGGREIERNLARKHDFTHTRTFWRMEIAMREAPPEPVLPDGITIRNYDPERDVRAVFEATDDAFADHWNHVPMSYDEWTARTERPDFDPTLWFVAVDGDEIAGTSLCRVQADMGWIGTLGVRRPWRRRGLGRALLLHSLGEWWRRGQPRVGLGVDAASLTGATRLYEAAGMHVNIRYDQYEKILRDGLDMATREIRD